MGGVYRFVVFATRVLRWLGWAAAAGMTINESVRFDSVLKTLESAPQEAAVAGVTLVHLFVFYVIARASDRTWSLVAEDLTERLSRRERATA